MKNRKYIALFIFLISINALAAPTAEVTVQVLDEQSAPVENAKVEYGFYDRIGSFDYTDKDGKSHPAGSTETPHISGVVKKVHYYTSLWGVNFTGSQGKYRDNISGIQGFRKWEPSNPIVNVELKKIINPIPLFVARAVWPYDKYGITPAAIPLTDAWVGYDLLKCDWVAPYGKGLISDFLFNLHRGDVEFDLYNWPTSYNASLEIKFSNEGDGIQEFYREVDRGSELISDHLAPLEGYTSYVNLPTDSKKQDPDAWKKTRPVERDKKGENYYFRVRTRLDDKGNVISALYGKIYGPFTWDLIARDRHEDPSLGKERYGHTGSVTFLYYINPEVNDANIEYNQINNLSIQDNPPENLMP